MLLACDFTCIFLLTVLLLLILEAKRIQLESTQCKAREHFACSQMQITQSLELQRLNLESWRAMLCSFCLLLSIVLNQVLNLGFVEP